MFAKNGDLNSPNAGFKVSSTYTPHIWWNTVEQSKRKEKSSKIMSLKPTQLLKCSFQEVQSSTHIEIQHTVDFSVSDTF